MRNQFVDSRSAKDIDKQVKLGAKQVLMRLGLIIDAVKNWDLKALYLPAPKRILIDSSLQPTKQRWSEGHEIIHSVLPWHEDTIFDDNRGTLTPACYEELEWEAY